MLHFFFLVSFVILSSFRTTFSLQKKSTFILAELYFKNLSFDKRIVCENKAAKLKLTIY
jgi:hypothetical protein